MLNSLQIIGNLGTAPELKATPQGLAVATFSVATTEKSSSDKEHTEWHRVTIFGKQAESAAKYLDKGSKVYVEGSIKTEQWTDKLGQKRYATKLIARRVLFLTKKSQLEVQDHSSNMNGDAFSHQTSNLDDIPF